MSRAAQYSVYFSDQYGNRLADASNFLKLDYARTVNSVGSLTLVLDGAYPLLPIVIPDGRIEVWRRVAGGREYLDTDTIWLIKELTQALDDDGRRTIAVRADTPLCVLGDPGRYVNNFAGSDEATRTGAADDLLRQIVRDQAGVSADPARNLNALLTVPINIGAGPSVTKAFAWRCVLDVLQEIAQDATEAGTYLAFDIVAITPQALEFQTFIGQRGIDRRFPSSSAPLIVGPDFGNMARCEVRTSYRDEVTYAMAGGQGEGTYRLVGEYLDTARAARSPFGRRETFISSTNYDTTAGLDNEARSVVRSGRPLRTVTGSLISTPDTQYGIDWGWGDYITAQVFGVQIDVRVDAIRVSVTDEAEEIVAQLQGETYE